MKTIKLTCNLKVNINVEDDEDIESAKRALETIITEGFDSSAEQYEDLTLDIEEVIDITHPH